MLRKALSGIAAAAITVATLTSVTPANAAVTSSEISPAIWDVGSSPAATVTYVTDASVSDPSIVVEWDWPVSYGTLTSTAASPSGKTYTCATTLITFTTTGSWSGSPTCTYDQGGSGDPGKHRVELTGATTSAGTVTVTFPAETVTATQTATGYGTWTIGGSGTSLATVRAYLPRSDSSGSVPFITIDIDPNGGKCSTSKVTGFYSEWTTAPNGLNCTHPNSWGFTGFNTRADGKGLAIPAGGNLHLTGDNRIYAQYLDPNASVFPPSAPTDVVATPGWNRLDVSWKAPVNTGSFPITNYLVSATPGGKVCISRLSDRDLTKCSFTNLTPGTKYTVRVQGLNGAGWGDFSMISNAASPYDLRITDYSRKKGNLFSLFKSTLTVKVATPGYAAGVKLTPMVKVGTGDFVKEGPVTTNGSGSLTWSKKFERKYDNTAVAVKFMDGENASNVVTNAASAKTKPTIKVKAFRETDANGQRIIVVTGTASDFLPGTSLTATVIQRGQTSATDVKPGQFRFTVKDVSPASPASVVVKGGGVISDEVPVTTR